MNTRPSAPGWCPSIPAVLGQPWWPGKLIYEGQSYTDAEGNEQVRLMALCPYCGKWVAIRGDSMMGHDLPKGSDASRLRKAEAAQELYGRLKARELMRAQASSECAVA